LRSDAVSPVGAKGLAQFMPNTWKQISKEMGYRTSITPFYTYEAIFAGAYYMRKLRNSWSWNRPQIEKHYLALASYNGGIGNVLKSQKLCNDALLWRDIKECLQQVTGHHSVETISYIERIKQWVSLL
jgi:soluble lytic murein transglycosylase-like protein